MKATMKATIVGLVTPHVLRVIDLSRQAETGVNVDWHLRDAVGKTLADIGHQYNATELMAAYVEGLESAADEAARSRKLSAGALRSAAAFAARELRARA